MIFVQKYKIVNDPNVYHMLAVNHAQLAVTITLAYSIHTNQAFYLPLIIFVVFAGVMPDIDHPSSELGRYFKPIAYTLPHRGVTHSFLGSALILFAIYLLTGFDRYFSIFLVLGAFFGWYLTKKIFKQHILRIDNHTKNLVSERQTEALLGVLDFVINFFLLIVLILLWNGQYRQEIYILIATGYLSHLIGDFVTIEGIPLFWPIKKKFGLKLFRTGGIIEGLIGFLLFFGNIYLIYLFGQEFNIWRFEYWNIRPLP